MRTGSKREFNSSHKANDLLWLSYICHLLGGFLHVNTRVVHMMVFITVLRTLTDYRTDKVFLGLRYIRSISPLSVDKSEENFGGRQVCPSWVPFVLLFAHRLFVVPSPAWLKQEIIQIGAKQMLSIWIFSIVSNFLPCSLKGINS